MRKKIFSMILAVIIFVLGITSTAFAKLESLSPGWWYLSLNGYRHPGGQLLLLPEGAYFEMNDIPNVYPQKLDTNELSDPKYLSNGIKIVRSVAGESIRIEAPGIFPDSMASAILNDFF